jgi:phosphatidate cytidylyltransferase
MIDRLRTLGPDQQVALLFVVLFALLLVGTATIVVWSLRQASGRRAGDYVQELGALWTGTTLFWLAWVSGTLGATLLFAVLSFFALREFVTLVHTRRADHRGLILAFFVVLPLQYLIVGARRFDLFTVFVPVYVFFAIPVAAALAGDPGRFLERNAKLQWGLMVCVYGLSHAPALLALTLQGREGVGAFLVFFLVVVAGAAQIVQEHGSHGLRRRPVVRRIDRSFSWRAWAMGVVAAALVGALLTWSTPLRLAEAAGLGALTGGAGTLGALVMEAIKRDAGVRHWGAQRSVTGAVGLLDRLAPLCFAAPVFFHSVRWYLGGV